MYMQVDLSLSWVYGTFFHVAIHLINASIIFRGGKSLFTVDRKDIYKHREETSTLPFTIAASFFRGDFS